MVLSQFKIGCESICKCMCSLRGVPAGHEGQGRQEAGQAGHDRQEAGGESSSCQRPGGTRFHLNISMENREIKIDSWKQNKEGRTNIKSTQGLSIGINTTRSIWVGIHVGQRIQMQTIKMTKQEPAEKVAKAISNETSSEQPSEPCPVQVVETVSDLKGQLWELKKHRRYVYKKVSTKMFNFCGSQTLN